MIPETVLDKYEEHFTEAYEEWSNHDPGDINNFKLFVMLMATQTALLKIVEHLEERIEKLENDHSKPSS